MRFLIAAAFAVVAAAVFYPALGWPKRARRAAWFACSVIVGVSPALVEIDDVDDSFQRTLAALLAIALLTKLYDVLHSPHVFCRRGFLFYGKYLTNWLWLVERHIPPPRDRSADYRQVQVSAPMAASGLALLVAIFALDWSHRPFALEHIVKSSAVFATLMPVTSFASAAWRLLFGPALEAMESPFLAATPADFWRRWNRPAQQFFTTYVFAPAGGRARPVFAALSTFFVSGAIHEYLFGIATGRIQGWQMLFFMTQGIAAIMTARWRPRGVLAPLGIAATIAFNLATSVWFFRSLAAAIPFYAERAGG